MSVASEEQLAVASEVVNWGLVEQKDSNLLTEAEKAALIKLNANLQGVA